MTRLEKVLVTGSAGRIGQTVVKELRSRGHTVRGLDRVPTPGIDDFVVGTIADPASVQQAMAGITTLIHLAATPDDVDDVLGDLFPANIVGLYHVLEAARHAKVRRLVLASSGQVVWHQRMTGPYPIKADTQPTPRYWYAATKMFLESIGYSFSEAHQMEVIAVRLGWCPRTPEQVQEINDNAWAKDVYLSPTDAGRFFACSVEAAGPIRFSVVYATSRPVQTTYLDPTPARNLLGYEAQESWPVGTEVVVGKRVG